MKKLAILLLILLMCPMLVGAQNDTNDTVPEEPSNDTFIDVLADKIASALWAKGEERVKEEAEAQKQGLMEEYGIEDNFAFLIFMGIALVVLFIIFKMTSSIIKWVLALVVIAILIALAKMTLG